MALDLKVSIKKEIDLLNKQLAALQDEIKRHELVYDMLDGKSSPRKRIGRPRGPAAPQTRGPSGSMIDWNAVFEALPSEFTLDTMGTNKTASEKPRAYLRQVVVRWSKEGRIKRTGRGLYQKI